MDGERILDFIAYVQEHTALWKKEDKDFINRDVRRKLLNDIGEKMGMTEEECRKKLKNLKDKMREICNKLPKTASGQPAFHKGIKIVRWPYFIPLLFMKDQFLNGRDNNYVEDYQFKAEGSAVSDDDRDCPPIHFEPPATDGLDSEQTFSLKSSGQESQMVVPRKRSRMNHTTKTKFIKRQTDDSYVDSERDDSDLGKSILSMEPSQSKMPIDEWGAFAESICHDLRKITNPYLIVSVKNDINKLVGETVIKQLNMSCQVSQVQETGIIFAESTGQLPSTSMAEFKTENF